MNKKAFSVISLLVIFLLFSCSDTNKNILEKESLFSIPLGKMADEIDYFQRDSLQFSADNDLVMKDGFFYLSNGRSGKLMKFNSYGDLLSLIYNPDRNPFPAELMSRDSDSTKVNRQVIPWQFNSPNSIAVTGKSIYIVDNVAQNRRIKENDVLLNYNILHFSENGEYLNFIGLEGVGGQPFPYIENIWTSESSELIVLYRTRKKDDASWFVNWYTVSGTLRYSVEIKESAIPMPAGETNLLISLDNVIPGRSNYEIYLKLSYFRREKNEISEVFGGTLNFNVEEEKWHSWSRLPDFKSTIDGVEIDSPYSLIGSVKEHQLFISLGVNNTYNLLIRNPEGRFKQVKTLEIDEKDILFKEFFISDDGILNAMVFTGKEAKIMWWRTDKLLQEGNADEK
jgi:hypothetical protein